MITMTEDGDHHWMRIAIITMRMVMHMMRLVTITIILLTRVIIRGLAAAADQRGDSVQLLGVAQDGRVEAIGQVLLVHCHQYFGKVCSPKHQRRSWPGDLWYFIPFFTTPHNRLWKEVPSSPEEVFQLHQDRLLLLSSISLKSKWQCFWPFWFFIIIVEVIHWDTGFLNVCQYVNHFQQNICHILVVLPIIWGKYDDKWL